MPVKPRRLCRQAGCPNLTREGYCEQHKRQLQRESDERRGTAARRGYGGRWQRYVRNYKIKHPLCRVCEAAGLTVPVYLVDHIVPVDGPDDPLFWDPKNHQPLCEVCHNRKRATEDKETWRKRGGK